VVGELRLPLLVTLSVLVRELPVLLILLNGDEVFEADLDVIL